MLESTFELISQAASNSLFVFCFCNLIIVLIVLGSKTNSGLDKRRGIPLSDVTKVEQQKYVELLGSQEKSSAISLSMATTDDQKIHVNLTGNEKSIETVKFSLNQENVEESEEDSYPKDDEELRKRIENFIAKINRERKEEILRTRQLR